MIGDDYVAIDKAFLYLVSTRFLLTLWEIIRQIVKSISIQLNIYKLNIYTDNRRQYYYVHKNINDKDSSVRRRIIVQATIIFSVCR